MLYFADTILISDNIKVIARPKDTKTRPSAIDRPKSTLGVAAQASCTSKTLGSQRSSFAQLGKLAKYEHAPPSPQLYSICSNDQTSRVNPIVKPVNTNKESILPQNQRFKTKPGKAIRAIAASQTRI